MLQAIVKKGKVIGEKVPAPNVSNNHLLIKVINSCISVGTETSSVNNSSKSLLQKAKEKPEKVKKVFDKIKSDGIKSTRSMVEYELNTGSETGYSISGIIEEIGEGVENFEVGDFVAATGAGIANHAEYVNVPVNLACKIPKDLSFENASTVALGAIAMQGVRRVDVRLGEFCVVLGTGFIGLLTIQLLKNVGARVIAIDLDENRLNLAKELGAEATFNGKEDVVKLVNQFTGGNGTDAVIFTAATSSNEPLSQSFKMCKRKGRVILVGVSGMLIDRADIYSKELDFQISTSYGPGRYDSNYEQKGIDYPFAYVRWTENRNMQDYLRLLNNKDIKLEKLVTHSFDIKDISNAFDTIKNGTENLLVVLVKYEDNKIKKEIEQKIILNKAEIKKDVINVALIGAGSFAKGTHLPNIEKLKNKFNLYAVMNRSGYKGKALGEHFKAQYVTTDYNKILDDKNVDLILISTRHDSHAELTLKALQKGKHVFVEKPLATNKEELQPIIDFYNSDVNNKPILTVGFNRRFSKYISEVKKHTDKRINPMVIYYRMNAGFVPLDHWIHENGGRIIGEGCHLIDLMTSLTNSKIKSISYENLTPTNE
ncbi:MAG: zinc-binding dehydrogenase, partial [Ignavibacteriae bacterium]|nr:zinc-binding dehydrogenase [Ignavibacteriota bacterium]